MKRFRLSLIVAAVTLLCLASSVVFHSRSESLLDCSKKKYEAITRARAEEASGREKLDAFNRCVAGLGGIAREQGPSVTYDISIRLSSLAELDPQIATTYASGFFFLKRGVLEEAPDGIHLAISGFRKGESRP